MRTFGLVARALDGRARPVAGDAAEHQAGDEPGAGRVVEIEDPADHLARRVEAGDRLVAQVEHLPALVVDAQPAEGEGDAAGHAVGLERRRVDDVRPV